MTPSLASTHSRIYMRIAAPPHKIHLRPSPFYICFPAPLRHLPPDSTVFILQIGDRKNEPNKLSPRGQRDDVPPPMAVRRWQKSRRIYIRPRTGPQSAHVWRRWWLNCRQPVKPRQLRHGTDRRTDRAIPKCPHTRAVHNISVFCYNCNSCNNFCCYKIKRH